VFHLQQKDLDIHICIVRPHRTDPEKITHITSSLQENIKVCIKYRSTDRSSPILYFAVNLTKYYQSSPNPTYNKYYQSSPNLTYNKYYQSSPSITYNKYAPMEVSTYKQIGTSTGVCGHSNQSIHDQHVHTMWQVC